MSTQSSESFLIRVFDTLAAWQRRAQDRRHLAHLTEWQRRDIGVSREALESEISKPFWRA